MSIRPLASDLALGAVSYWGLDLLLHYFRMSSPSRLEVALPAIIAVAFFAALFSRGLKKSSLLLAPRMLLGIWLASPLYMLTITLIERPEQVSGVFLLRAFLGIFIFPAITFMLSAYDASMLALGITSGMLLLFTALQFAFSIPEERSPGKQ